MPVVARMIVDHYGARSSIPATAQQKYVFTRHAGIGKPVPLIRQAQPIRLRPLPGDRFNGAMTIQKGWTMPHSAPALSTQPTAPTVSADAAQDGARYERQSSRKRKKRGCNMLKSILLASAIALAVVGNASAADKWTDEETSAGLKKSRAHALRAVR
jgi:hypothetical protein